MLGCNSSSSKPSVLAGRVALIRHLLPQFRYRNHTAGDRHDILLDSRVVNNGGHPRIRFLNSSCFKVLRVVLTLGIYSLCIIM